MSVRSNQFVTIAGLFSCSIALLAPVVAHAQVVYSLGAQEIYDSNIFLEDDGKASPIVVLDAQGNPQQILTRQADGKENDDLITQVGVGVSSALPFHKYVTGSAEGKVGALIFADENEESRLTLDSNVKISGSQDFLPDRLTVDLTSALKSGPQGIDSAKGTASRSSVSHDGLLDIHYGDIDLGRNTTLGGNYNFTRHDFIGELLFQGNREDVPENDPRFEERGSDYISNSAGLELGHKFTQNTQTKLNSGVTDYRFTHTESNALTTAAEDPDRLDWITRLSNDYTVSEQVVVKANVGYNLSHLTDDPTERTVTFIADDGSTSTATIKPNRNESSLLFGGSVSYKPAVDTTLEAGIDQNVGTNIDGQRTLYRVITLNGAQNIGERTSLFASGSLTQFEEGENLGNATDRYEAGAGVRYSFTESLSVTAGYSYANQDVGDINETVAFGANDYESHRVYIGLNAGIVGLSG